ncbi:MAG TPA: LLM class flavin-dependent oxidoreductase [Egibacteraceae bacterium]|nr:LLM class flavin-dependent oxidoreductase [Egibacteraceae bacterium]
MELGAHLPLADFGDGIPTGADLRTYAAEAVDLGFSILSANDHLVWKRPWLDGPAALAAILGAAGGATLATSIALPVVRHPVVLAKALASLAFLAEGPVIAGLGPGSSSADYHAVGVPFSERWARFDESVRLVRSLLHGEAVIDGGFYDGEGLSLSPLPEVPPQIWFGSWGSDARLRRMAAVADGWFASAYNTTPDRFADARSRLDAHLAAAGRDPTAFPDGLATMWLHVTDDPRDARGVLEDLLAPILARPPDELGRQLPIGSAEHCVQLLRRYAAAGAQRVLLWPLRDSVAQLQAFAEQVAPHIEGGNDPAARPQP